MFNWRGLGKAVLCLHVFSFCGLPLSGGTAKVPKQDRAWKQYRNAHQGYCVSYPSRWLKDRSYSDAGLFIRTGVTKFSANPLGGIDVSVQEQADPVPRAASLDLANSLQFHLESMVKFQRAQRIQVIEKRLMTIADSPAIFVKDQYFDPLERASWLEEVIFASQGNQLYRLELVCRAKEAERFERVFQRVVKSFSFHCDSTR